MSKRIQTKKRSTVVELLNSMIAKEVPDVSLSIINDFVNNKFLAMGSMDFLDELCTVPSKDYPLSKESIRSSQNNLEILTLDGNDDEDF